MGARGRSRAETHRLGAVTVGRGHPTAAQLPGAAANIPGTIRPGARNKREDNARSAQATGFSRGATWGRPDASTLALYLGTTWDTFPIPKYFHGSFPKYIEHIISRCTETTREDPDERLGRISINFGIFVMSKTPDRSERRK